MPRLLVVTTAPPSLRFLLPFASHFRKAGWIVDAMTGAPDGRDDWQREFDHSYNVEWTRSPLALPSLLRACGQVRDIVALGRYDIVHVHTPVAAFVTRAVIGLRRPTRRPCIVYTAHGFHFHPGGRRVRNAVFLALEKLAGRWTDYLVVLNREDAAAAVRARIVPAARVRRMPGIGVDLGYYSADRVAESDVRRVRAELGLGDARCFLMVAELNPRKRHVDLVHAFAVVAADPTLPHARLLLAGGGRLRHDVEAEARRLAVADRVHFLGVRYDIPVLLRLSTALVLPSEREGLPRSVLEAMAMGLPVIGTRIRGTAELLEDGAGYVHEVGDVAALSGLMRDVLIDPATASSVARRARERVARYDLSKVVGCHVDLYREILSARSATAPGPVRAGDAPAVAAPPRAR